MTKQDKADVADARAAYARCVAEKIQLRAALEAARATLAVLQPNNRYPDGSIKPGPSELLRKIDAVMGATS